jgi:transcriptional regulator with XRE-family HTH domain
MTPSDETTRTRLGRRIRAERERRGWTQEHLAREVGRISNGKVGLARSTLARLEGGEREPGLEEGVYLAQALGVPLVALLAPDDDDVRVRAQLLIQQHEAAQGHLADLAVQHSLAAARARELEAQADALLAEATRRGIDLTDLAAALEEWRSPF